MSERSKKRGWLRARTLYLLLAIALFWVSCFHWDAFLYGTVFALAPFTVLMVGAALARGQIKRNAYNVLLFVLAGIFIQAAVRNGNLSPRGLLIAVLGLSAVLIAPRAFGKGKRRGAFLAGFILIVLALAALVLTAICECFEIGGILPWVSKQAAARGGHSASVRIRQAREQTQLMKGLTVLTYACGAMLVAGIVPREMDDDDLRRESGVVCLFVALSALAFILPAVVSVFIARPIVLPFLPEEKIGIQAVGAIGDRIRSLQHANKVAELAAVGFFCALYCLIMSGTAKRLRVVLAASMVIFLMALAHTQSRGSDIALGLGVGALAFRAGFHRLEGRRWRICASLVSAGLAMVLTVLLINVLFTADVFIANRLNASAKAEEATTGNLLESLRQNAALKEYEEKAEAAAQADSATEVADGVVVSRTLSSGLMGIFSSGRDRIWMEAIDYLVHNPADLVLGMGSGDVIDRMKAYNPNRYYSYHLHNGLLEVLARGGVFMLIGVVWLLCMLVRPAARMLAASDARDAGGCVFPIIIGVLLAISMVEALLFTDASAYNVLFFWAAARVMRPSVPEN